MKKIDSEVHSLAEKMIETMHLYRGLGLAAPQVGISRQIIVVNPGAQPGEETVYINPKILKRKGRELGEEGCLSFPGVYGKVMRAQWIQVSALLLTGEQVLFEAEDFPARVLQHEIDHLNGALFVEKLQPADKVVVRKQLREMEQAQALGLKIMEPK